MFSTKSKNTIESSVTGPDGKTLLYPGVKFTVRTLNKIQRAARDLPIADHAAEADTLSEEWRALQPTGYFTDLQAASVKARAAQVDIENATDENRESRQAELDKAKAHFAEIHTRVSALDTPENIRARSIIGYKVDLLISAHVKPAAIRAALVSIDGLEIDGRPATAEALMGQAGADCDDLIEEIYAACESAAGLTAAERKNSASLTTSSGQVAIEPTTSSVAPAGSGNSIT